MWERVGIVDNTSGLGLFTGNYRKDRNDQRIWRKVVCAFILRDVK
jgi:hypothetical protein